MTYVTSAPRGIRKRLLPRLMVLPLLASLGACDSLLEVDMPGQLTEDQLIRPEMASLMVTGAIAAFECAHVSYTLGAAGISHEYLDASGWPTFAVFANRQVENNTGAVNTGGCSGATNFGFFRPLQTARFQAEQAYNAITSFTPEQVANREALLATSAAYAGYAYTFLGEAWCQMTVDGGPLMTPQQTLARAEEWFTRAITHADAAGTVTAPGTTNVRHLAALGRARVRLDLGNLQGAAADAATIPAGFLASSTRSTANLDRRNMVYVHMTLNKFVTVGPSYRNLTVEGIPDPRVPVAAAASGVTNDGATPWWNQRKYTSDVQPLPLARWAEAQLILAEAAGSGPLAVAYVNNVRAQRGIPFYTGPSTAAAVRDLVVEERRREFFLEGRRHADMLRYKLPFPTGVGHKGTPYGSTTCYPLARAELDGNPNLSRS